MNNSYKLITILIPILSFFGCTFKTVPEDMVVAERLIRSNPDSSIIILESSPSKTALDKEEYAIWALLNVWARYASYSSQIPVVELDYATDYFIRNGNSLRKAQSYYLRGSVNQELKRGRSASWFEDLHKGCLEADKCKDYRLASLLYQHYGSQLNDRKWYDDGLNAMLKSLHYAEMAKDTNIIVKDLINISHCHISMGNVQEGMEYARKSYDIAKESRSSDAVSRTLSAISFCYSLQQQYDSALLYSRNSVNLQEELYRKGDRKDPVRYDAIAEAWKNLNNADSCIFYSMKDYGSSSVITRLNAIQHLYDCYSSLKINKDSSLKYLTEYKDLSALKEENDENSKIIQDNSLIDKQLENKRELSVIITNIVAVLIIFAVIGIFVYIYHMRIKRWQRRMEKIESELHIKAIQDSDIVNRMTDKIIDSNNIIRSLRLKPHYLDDDNWNEIETTVNDAYNNYCNNLRNSGFTSNNVHVAILMRLRFSTADSATILGISPASYTKAKQRLKGKIPT